MISDSEPLLTIPLTERLDLLEPVLDLVQEVHGDGVDHRHLAAVFLEDEHHVKVLDVELDSLKVEQLHLVQRDDKRRLQRETDAFI